MADGRGGARTPDNRPRPPAGPGRLANRQDLSQPAPAQPVQAPPGLMYGNRQMVEQAQQTNPAPALRPPPAQPQPQGRPAQGGQPVVPTLAQILARPTNRPTEPVTAGVPVGAGPNMLVSAPDGGSVSAIIERAAMATGSPVLRELAQRASASGQ